MIPDTTNSIDRLIKLKQMNLEIDNIPCVSPKTIIILSLFKVYLNISIFKWYVNFI